MKDNSSNKKDKRRISVITLIWIILTILIIYTVFVIVINYLNLKKENEIFEIDSSIPIPDGFYYVGGTKNTGFVISDDKSDYKKGVSYGSLKKLKGNQFVWVPVDTTISNTEEEIKQLVEEKKYPMAVKNDNGYRGLLYTFNSYDKYYYPILDNIEIQEPKILSDKIYGDSEEMLNGSTQDLYQDSYNKMIESVNKNKGFYISRFEAGNLSSVLTDNPNIVSKSGQTDLSYISWFDMYKGVEKMYDRDDITTEIIWGSQWDAALRWMCDNNESFYNLNYENGNYSGKIIETGSDSRYSINNIYDMCGNVSEWTQSGAREASRISRGSNYSSVKFIADMEYFDVTYLHEEVGTRITMYIN